MSSRDGFVRSALIALVLCSGAVAQAAPIFFLGDEAVSPVLPNSLTKVLGGSAAGSTGTLNIFATADTRLSGVSLDLMAVGDPISGQAIRFSAPVSVPGIGSRWTFQDGPLQITDSLVKSIGGAAIPFVSGTGIGPGSSDPGLDVNAAYLIASVGYQVIGDLGSRSDLFLRIGDNTVSQWDDQILLVQLGGDNLNLPVPGAVPGSTDLIADGSFSIVPEPTGLILACVGLVGLAGVFRRRNK